MCCLRCVKVDVELLLICMWLKWFDSVWIVVLRFLVFFDGCGCLWVLSVVVSVLMCCFSMVKLLLGVEVWVIWLILDDNSCMFLVRWVSVLLEVMLEMMLCSVVMVFLS